MAMPWARSALEDGVVVGPARLGTSDTARAWAVSLAVTLLGAACLWSVTDGLRAFTSETARRMAVIDSPRSVPDIVMEDQDGRLFRMSDLRGQPVAVEFVYTRCGTVCTQLGLSFEQLYSELRGELHDGGPLLLSVSFDPAYDTPERLTGFAARYGADGEGWRIARPADADDLDEMLRAFGVIVIDDGFGGFEHNAALHLVDAAGRLVSIHDLDDAEGLLRALRAGS